MSETLNGLNNMDVTVLLAMSMKEVLKFEDKPLEIVEKKSHLRLRPLRKLRERRTINTKHEQIPTTRGTKRPRNTDSENEPHQETALPKLKKSCKNVISPLGKENSKCFQRKASKEGFLFNSRRKNNATPLWLKVVKERHGIACQQQLRQTTMLI
ncbi:uncharacterized protein LOC144750949 [Ciona intestinalis]